MKNNAVGNKNDKNTTTTPQKKAEQLLQMADAIERSSQERKSMLADIMLLNSNSGNAHGDSDFDNSHDLLDAVALDDKSIQSHISMDEVTLGSTHSRQSTSSSVMQKVSKKQKIAELKQQLQDCQAGLVSVQENAALKYRKLEMEHVDLQEALETLKQDTESTVSGLERDKQDLVRKLTSAVGADRVDWWTEMQSKQLELEQQLETITLERDQAVKDSQGLRQIVNACSTCSNKANSGGRDSAVSGPSKRGTLRSMSKRALFSWTTLLHLDQEAENTPTHAMSPSNNNMKPTRSIQVEYFNRQPYQETFMLREQSQRIKDDLDAEVEAMQEKMKADVEALRSEWTKSTPKIYTSHHKSKSTTLSTSSSSHKKRSPRDSADKKGSSSSSNARNNSSKSTLDMFFSQATAGLEDEEMDEEKSFYSMQRSVNTAPPTMSHQRGEQKRTRKSTKSSRVSSSMTTRVETDIDNMSLPMEPHRDQVGLDRRSRMMRGSSIRDTFAQKLSLLKGEEVNEASEAHSPPTRTRMPRDSIGSISSMTTTASKSVRWNPNKSDSSNNNEEDDEDDDDPLRFMSKEVEAWGGIAATTVL